MTTYAWKPRPQKTLSYQLSRLAACPNAKQWAEPYKDHYEDAWWECDHPDWLAWIVAMTLGGNIGSRERERLARCMWRCVEPLLPGTEEDKQGRLEAFLADEILFCDLDPDMPWEYEFYDIVNSTTGIMVALSCGCFLEAYDDSNLKSEYIQTRSLQVIRHEYSLDEIMEAADKMNL